MWSKSNRYIVWILTVFSCFCWLKFQVINAEICHPVDECTCRTQDGKFISLWDIDTRFEVMDRASRGFTYVYRPCSTFSNAGTECKDVLGCQTNGDKTASFAIAYKPKKITTSYDQNQLIFKYVGSTDSSTGTQRQTDVILKCDLSAKTASLDTVYENPSLYYTTTLTTQCACPGKCNYNPKNSSNKKGGLSTGSILCIVLLVLVIVYLIGGMLIYKYALHKEGWDIIPLRTFWKDLPLLVKDGAVFTYRKVTGKKGAYQELS